MDKRLLIIVLTLSLVVTTVAVQVVEGKKGILIPNAALVITSNQPVEKVPAKKPEPEASQPPPPASPAPEAVQQAPDATPAPKVVKQEGVSDYGNYAAVDYLNLGISLYNEGMYEKAIDAFKQVLLITPGYADTHYNLALTYLALGNGSAALKEYQTLKAMDAAMAERLYGEVTHQAMSSVDNKFAVQVGAFKNSAYAQAMVDKLKGKYFHAYIEKTDQYNKVRICGIKSKAEGSRMMLDIGDEFHVKPYLVRLK